MIFLHIGVIVLIIATIPFGIGIYKDAKKQMKILNKKEYDRKI
jgi:hypothetical protein